MQTVNPAFTLLLSMPGGSEWILILVVVLLIFAGKKIPELMRGLGKGVWEFKDAKNSAKNEIEKGTNEKETTETMPPYPPSAV